jgi:hypothetical protein
MSNSHHVFANGKNTNPTAFNHCRSLIFRFIPNAHNSRLLIRSETIFVYKTKLINRLTFLSKICAYLSIFFIEFGAGRLMRNFEGLFCHLLRTLSLAGTEKGSST